MKKLIFIVFSFFSVVVSSHAQSNTADEFYSYLNTILENEKNKSFDLMVTIYGYFGDKSKWEAKFKKDKDKIEVQFFSQIPKENEDSVVTRLDTTFIILRKELIKNFESEIVLEKSRPVFLEESYKVVVNVENPNKVFRLKKMDGLYYLLRYNKSWEQGFNKWKVKEESKK